MALITPDGRSFEANAELCGRLGYSREELFTKAFQELTHPDDLAEDLANINRLLADKMYS